MVHSVSGHNFLDEAVSRFYRWKEDFVDDIFFSDLSGDDGFGPGPLFQPWVVAGICKTWYDIILMKLKKAEQCEYAEATNVPRHQKKDGSRYTVSRVSCEC